MKRPLLGKLLACAAGGAIAVAQGKEAIEV